jgi:uncharacterized protein (DUF1778 family)
VSDDLIDRLAAEADAGFDAGAPWWRDHGDREHPRPYAHTDNGIGAAMTNSSASGRFEFEVRPELEELIERAASLTNQSPSDFARTAVEERAADVIRWDHELVTRVPPDVFDALLASLDDPTESNDALSRAAARLDSIVDRR